MGNENEAKGKRKLANFDACAPVILDSVKSLSDSVDEYWG